VLAAQSILFILAVNAVGPLRYVLSIDTVDDQVYSTRHFWCTVEQEYIDPLAFRESHQLEQSNADDIDGEIITASHGLSGRSLAFSAAQ
jgi:hypothetical protein